MARPSPTLPLIILDGNSIPTAYGTNLSNRLTTRYGAGNYEFVNISTGGQTLEDMIADWRSDVWTRFGGFRKFNVLVFQEIRNQMAVSGSTPEQTFEFLKTYVRNIKSIAPAWAQIRVLPITATAAVGDDVDAVNQMIRDDLTGDWDGYIDLYSHSTFNDYTSALFNVDEVHLSGSGSIAAGNYIGDQIWSRCPIIIPYVQ